MDSIIKNELIRASASKTCLDVIVKNGAHVVGTVLSYSSDAIKMDTPTGWQVVRLDAVSTIKEAAQ